MSPRHNPITCDESRAMARSMLDHARAYVVVTLPLQGSVGRLMMDAATRADLKALAKILKARFEKAYLAEHAILGMKSLKRARA